MKNIVFVVGAVMALTACSRPSPDTKTVAKGTFTIAPPFEMSQNPKVRREQQSGLVADMLADPRIGLDIIEGEAYRRGVTLTPEQIAAKKAQKSLPPGTPLHPESEATVATEPSNSSLASR